MVIKVGRLIVAVQIFIVATLTTAEYGALLTALIAFTVFLQTLGLLALAAFPYFLVLNPEAKDLIFRCFLLRSLLVIEAMTDRVCVSGQRLDDCLLMLFFIVDVVAAVLTVALLAAEHLLLETVAVELETAGSFAVATQFNFLLQMFFFVIYLGNYYDVARAL